MEYLYANNPCTSVIYHTYKQSSRIPLTLRQRSITTHCVSLFLAPKQRMFRLMKSITTRDYTRTHPLPTLTLRKTLYTHTRSQPIYLASSAYLYLHLASSARLQGRRLHITTSLAPVTYNRVRTMYSLPSSQTKAVNVTARTIGSRLSPSRSSTRPWGQRDVHLLRGPYTQLDWPQSLPQHAQWVDTPKRFPHEGKPSPS